MPWGPSSRLDRLLWACHSRSCLTRVFWTIVIAVHQPFFLTRVTFALQLLLLHNARLLPLLPIDFNLKNDPVCNHRAETVPASPLPHCKTFGGVLRLP
jgi:hypothetical protein